MKCTLVLGYHQVTFPSKGGSHLAESEIPHANEMNGNSFSVFDTPCKTVYYQFTHAEQNVSDKSGTHSSLQNCGSSLSLLLCHPSAAKNLKVTPWTRSKSVNPWVTCDIPCMLQH